MLLIVLLLGYHLLKISFIHISFDQANFLLGVVKDGVISLQKLIPEYPLSSSWQIDPLPQIVNDLV